MEFDPEYNNYVVQILCNFQLNFELKKSSGQDLLIYFLRQFGLQQYGFYGRKEITVYSKIRPLLPLLLLRKLSFIRSYGWNLSKLPFVIVLLIGGNIWLCVWVFRCNLLYLFRVVVGVVSLMASWLCKYFSDGSPFAHLVQVVPLWFYFNLILICSKKRVFFFWLQLKKSSYTKNQRLTLKK